MLPPQVDAYIKAEKKYALTPVFPDADVERTSVARLTSRLDAYLARLDTDKTRCARLRDTIERYQFGMGLSVGASKFTSKVDETIGEAGSEANLLFLRTVLLECWRKIKSEKLTLREEAYVPGLAKRKLAVLGTATQQRAEGESRELCSAEDLRAAAAARQTFPARRRIRDSTLPQITTALIGERVKVCYDIEYDDGNGESYEGLFWFHGEIVKLGGREHGGGQKGTIIIQFDDGSRDSLLANRPTLWEVEEAGAWCFERKRDDGDDDDDDDDAGEDESESGDGDHESGEEEEEAEEDNEMDAE